MSDEDVRLTICAICGVRADFARGDHRSTRESFPCPNCRATLRYRDQAALIVDEFGRGQHLSIQQMARSGILDSVDIFEAALHGPFVRTMSHLPRYKRSYYWDDGKPGDVRDGVPFGDLTSLEFDDNSFDLVLSSDVMEHVVEPYAAFEEIARVLKPGGVYIFSIPTAWPLPDESAMRIEVVDGEIHHLVEPRYHRAGDGGDSLVTIDYGADLIEALAPFGLKLQIVRRCFPHDEVYRNASFVARKLHA